MTMQLSVVAGLAAVVIGGLTAIGAAGRMPSLRLLLRGYVNVMPRHPVAGAAVLTLFYVGRGAQYRSFCHWSIGFGII